MPLPQPDSHNLISGIRDNYRRGTVGTFLKETIRPEAKLSVVSAFFTIYAHAALKDELAAIASLRFLFGEPRFVKTLDPEKTDTKSFKIEDEGLKLDNQLEQRRAARECAAWLAHKKVVLNPLSHSQLVTLAKAEVQGAINAVNDFSLIP